MILKYVKVLIGEQEQLPVCIFQHPPFDGVYIIAAVSVAALLIGAEIKIVRLPAADVCGSSVDHCATVGGTRAGGGGGTCPCLSGTE